MTKRAHIPPYRAMIDRRTGNVVGPVVPIDPKDWPYSEIDPSEVLWRYMDFRKFDDLVRTSAIYFSRPDKFKDPFEGRFSPANWIRMSSSDAAFYAAYRIDRSQDDAESAQETMRRCVFISCWQRGRKENREMWNAYTSNPESVVVTSSAKALDRFLPEKIVKSPVKYHHDNYPRTQFGYTTLFFYKPADYRIEHEFRLLLTPGENESISYEDFGRRVPVNLKKIIHRVISHPRATKEFKAMVDELVGVHLKRIRREDSSLLP